MPDSWRLASAAVLAAVAFVVWFAFLRRGPEQAVHGTIVSKDHRAGGTYIQQPVEANRGFRTPRDIPIAESFAFELRLDGVAGPVYASFNTVKSRQFEAGQRVVVRYVEHGLGPFWRRITVVDMFPAEAR